MATWRLSAFALVLLFLPLAAAAQVGTGRIAGTIRDERGRPIKGATITAQNDQYFPRTLTSATDAKGRFGILGLRTATYTFTVHADGFEVATLTLPVRSVQPNPPLEVRLVRKLEPAPPPILANVDIEELQQDLAAAADLAASRQIDAAIAAYKRILKGTPALTSVNLPLGSLYEAQGDRASAVAAYEAALKGGLASSTARDALARLRKP